MNTETNRNTMTAMTDNDTVNTNDQTAMKEDITMNITFDQIARVNATLSTIDVKGKKYTPVVERIKAFRMLYPQGSIVTELVSCQDGVCIMKAAVATGNGVVLGTGTAFERMDSSFINKTSYIENCETSAVGRALGMAGIGIDASLCSADELLNAVKQQNAIKSDDPTPPDPPKKTRVAIVKELCAGVGISLEQFGAYRNAAVKGGVIKDQRVSELSDEDFDVLCRFVSLNAVQPA